jgi:tryptophanyl-tRNA synthetase
MRAHAFKDHEAKDKEVNVGLFNYPVLMAADILIYGADVVPVGADQKQHIEYARDIAGFYNRAWGVEQFKLPKDHILESVGTIPGTDGEKMSKSKGNVISLFGTDEEVKKSVMGIVTDSATPEEKKNPDTNNIYNIHKHFLTAEENNALRAKFEDGGYGYKAAKDDLLATIMKWREGKVEVYNDLMSHPEKINSILDQGGAVARVKANEMMSEVRKQTGLSIVA